MGAYTYSGTAASNTTVDGIGAAGSDSPDNIDNLVRALAASDANLVRDLGGNNTVAGSADAITVALADASTPTYFDGMIFSFRAASDNATTTPTLNVDSLGAKTIKKVIQGVESALVAGDIQAGQTCQVVYRSAWSTGTGAFELLNPSIASSIELGHATDTTLTRSAAGVMAVEGNVVPSPASQAQYDMLVRGASSWDRLAIGTSNGMLLGVRSGTPTWTNASTFDTVKASTSGSSVDFTGIPSWVREIDILFDAVSLSGTDNLLIQIGDSGGLETTGYVSSTARPVNGGATVGSNSTSGFVSLMNGASVSASGIMSLKNITGNIWVAFGLLTDGTANATFTSAGTKTLSATLDRVSVTRTGTNTFDAGQINICYR